MGLKLRLILLGAVVLIWSGKGLWAQRLDPLTIDQRRTGFTQEKNVSSEVLRLPFFDDFASYTGSPDTNLWQPNGGTYVNREFAYNPPSYGVATFDGLDATGVPYNTSNPSASGKTDVLVSNVIDLSEQPDSVFLSFFYQPSGMGNVQPNPGDSLKVFMKDTSGSWLQAWSVYIDSVKDFEQVLIPITDVQFLHGQFQFKFESYGNKSGMYDVWNLDYVYVDKGMDTSGTFYFNDIAISNYPNSYLKNYTAMPFNQFLADAINEIADSMLVTVNNFENSNNFPIPYSEKCVLEELYSTTPNVIFSQGGFMASKARQHVVSTGTSDLNLFADNNAMQIESRFSIGTLNPERGDTISSVIPDTVITTTGNVLIGVGDEISVNGNYYYVEEGLSLSLLTGDSMCFENDTFVIAQNITLNPVGILEQITTKHNDSISRICYLEDYFAYDDGTAEKTFVMDQKYGQVAYRFDLNVPDTLIGIEINFPTTARGVDGQSIDLIVWHDIDIPLAQNDSFLHTEPIAVYFSESPNSFDVIRYSKEIPVSGHFYVGWQVTGDEEVHIGYDVNESCNGNIYVKMSDSWSSFASSGALMIRPVMSSGDRFAGTRDEEMVGQTLKMYPNPTRDRLFLSERVERIQLYDQLGALLKEAYNTDNINLMDLSPGIYFVQYLQHGSLGTGKIVRSK